MNHAKSFKNKIFQREKTNKEVIVLKNCIRQASKVTVETIINHSSGTDGMDALQKSCKSGVLRTDQHEWAPEQL